MLYVYETTPRNRGWLCPWNGGIKQLDLQTVLCPLLLRALYHIITSGGREVAGRGRGREGGKAGKEAQNKPFFREL